MSNIGPFKEDGTLKTSEEIIAEAREIESIALAKQIREERDILIQEIEWILFPHSAATSECKTEVLEYIVALRNITEQQGFPFDVVFPLKPNYVKV